ncbi:MAG: alpha/beta hydrolase family protein [Moraxellaceae bacterium]|jgi:pimeloyl-ACP methyl ester carboxylesterase
MNTCIKVVFILLFCTSPLFGKNKIDGVWHASFTVMGQAMLLDLTVKSGGKEVAISNPEMEVAPQIPGGNVVFKKNKLSFNVAFIGLEFKGTFFPKGDSIVGVMNQSGITWDVKFFRTIQKKNKVNRPQTPKEPFPYETQEVSFQNPKDNVQIFGTFTYPINKNSNYPIVFLASGSGPQDRNCTILGHQSFLLIADQFARAGIATFRFDDRGAGESKANFSLAALSDFVSDLTTSINYFAQDEQLKGHPFGLLGHSEGGMHIMEAYKQTKEQIDFLVFMAACGVSGKDVLVQQQYEMPLAEGLNEEIALWNKTLFQGLSERVLAESDLVKCAFNIEAFLKEMYAKAPKGAISEAMNEETFVANNAAFLNNQWGRQFLAFNPTEYLKTIEVPLIALFGSKDIQVNPIINSEAFRSALSSSQLKRAQITVLPQLNHLFQQCNTCNFKEYGDLEETMSPLVFEQLIPFILKQ